MNKELQQKLKNLLENIPRTYDDFVRAILEDCDTDERIQKMIAYIEGKEEATTSDVIEFCDDEIWPERI